MGQIVGEGLVQPGEGLHLFLTNAAGQTAVPGGDGCGLNQHGHIWDTRTGGANHAVDFVLAQNLFHGSSRLVCVFRSRFQRVVAWFGAYSER